MEQRETIKPDLSSLRIHRDDDESGGRRGLRVVLLGTLLIVIAGGVLVGYRMWGSATTPEVQVARATIDSSSAGVEILTATGYVVADRKAAVSPKISGRLEYLGVDSGSRVKPGQIIARLEHHDLDAQLEDARGNLANLEAAGAQAEAELAQARANLAQAQANQRKSGLELARQTKLVEGGVTSKADLDNVTAQARVDEQQVKATEAAIRAAQSKIDSMTAQVRSSRARIQWAEAQIEYTNIRSPFEGLVISKDAEVGETVAPATFGGINTRGSVVTIVDPNSLEVEADINESSIVKITPGLEAEITLDALGSLKLPGETRKVVPTADRQKATVKVKVKFKNIDPRILPDMSAKALRGVSETGLAMRPQIKIVEGRMFHPEVGEAIVSRKIADRFSGAGPGQTLQLGRRGLTIVGVFDAGGTGFDSEIWSHVTDVADAFDRSGYSSVLLRAESVATRDQLANRIAAEQRLKLEAKPEVTYYQEQTGTSAPIKGLGIFVAIILGIGACFGGMNTMYAAVAYRTREIGTLRALGFSKASIMLSFVIESMLIALIGGVVGCLLALPVNGIATGTMNFRTFSEVAFSFKITPDLFISALIFAAVLGLLGGLLPSRMAARMPITKALREI